MVIQPATRLGPYEILSAIGAGGMGEVYKARDTRLGRIVAIKVLPAHLADKPELRERFEREARTIAGLNHPHICTLYDVGHQDGTDFLVMEYVEGETLAVRLLKGSLPLDQVLQYAIELADALDKAHRKGVTHRDIKPGNVMLTKSGTKLLDFGLAKLKEEAAPADSISQMPTLSHNPTSQGTLLGTIQYMAPEQVEGRNDEVDARTDIFAFGVVVYEMATGKKAFDGKTNASVMSKIMQVDPPPMSSLQPMTPPALDRVVKRCLAKDPDARWQNAGDLAYELNYAAQAGPEAAAAPIPHSGSAQLGRRMALLLILAAGVLAAAAAMLAWNLKPAPPSPTEVRTEINTPPTGDLISFALSPDGQQIVFVGAGDGLPQLWLRRLESTSSQAMPGTEGASYPFWSPDGRTVGFFADGKLKRVELAGGLPRTLADASNRGGSWSPEGTILFARTSASGLFRIAASGGEPTPVTTLEKQNSHRFPQFLPGFRQFIFYAQGTAETAGIYLGSLDSAKTQRLIAVDSNAAVGPNGWVFFIRAGALLAQRLDVKSAALQGDPVTVADAVVSDSIFGGAFSVSSSGLAAYRPGMAARHQLIWYDRSGKTLGTMGAPDTANLVTAHLSPDGRRAVAYRTIQENSDIWIFDATRATRLTFDASLDRYPTWSADGSRVVFDSNRKGHRDLYMKSADGAGGDELLLASDQDKVVNSWSRDGKFLMYHSIDPQMARDLWILPLEGERKPFLFLKTNFDERNGQFSPEGHWVAYASNESGRYEIYVRRFDGKSSAEGAGGQWQVSTAGGIYPRWRSDSRELYYLAPDGKLMVVPLATPTGAIEPGTPAVLFGPRILGGGSDLNVGWQYDVSRDGNFLINTVLDANSPITLIQNWNPDAKK